MSEKKEEGQEELIEPVSKESLEKTIYDRSLPILERETAAIIYASLNGEFRAKWQNLSRYNGAAKFDILYREKDIEDNIDKKIDSSSQKFFS